jgi:hypothetical protein
MNEDTLFTVLQALPTAIETPLVIFDNPEQALTWIQFNGFEKVNLWIITNDERQYWVVSDDVGSQLINMGFRRIIVKRPPVLPQSSEVPGDETV